MFVYILIEMLQNKFEKKFWKTDFVLNYFLENPQKLPLITPQWFPHFILFDYLLDY